MSESPISFYEGDRNELNERDGNGTAHYTNGDVYTGQFLKGKRHGLGIYKYFENQVQVAFYDGYWNNGNKEGKGKYSYMDGGYYDGDFINGDRDGHGSYVYGNQDKYNGQWKNNKKNGLGEYFKYETKLLIKGEWEDGLIKGSVHVVREDAEIEGTIENGVLADYKVLTIDGITAPVLPVQPIQPVLPVEPIV